MNAATRHHFAEALAWLASAECPDDGIRAEAKGILDDLIYIGHNHLDSAIGSRAGRAENPKQTHAISVHGGSR